MNLIDLVISLAILVAIITVPFMLFRIINQLKLISLSMGILPEEMVCPDCKREVVLEDAERAAGKVYCPNCKKAFSSTKYQPES